MVTQLLSFSSVFFLNDNFFSVNMHFFPLSIRLIVIFFLTNKESYPQISIIFRLFDHPKEEDILQTHLKIKFEKRKESIFIASKLELYLSALFCLDKMNFSSVIFFIQTKNYFRFFSVVAMSRLLVNGLRLYIVRVLEDLVAVLSLPLPMPTLRDFSSKNRPMPIFL